MRWVLPLLLALGCGDKIDPNATGIELTLTYEPSTIDQVEITGWHVLYQDPAFESGRLPSPPKLLTEGESSLVIALPEELAGMSLTILAVGLLEGEGVSRAEVEATIEAKKLVRASGHLDPLGRAICGDGTIEMGEQCDDRNATAGDGCSNSCGIERGYACSGSPSVCDTVCGDGLVVKEACDDGNDTAADGCTGCLLDPGYTCIGEPSDCTCEGDTDGDGISDCQDTCLDSDDDGYGRAGGAADTCTGPDCDDTSAMCTTTCDDADVDQIFDCKDDCIDGDGDLYGLGTGCMGADCDDLVPTCTSTCTGDLDADGTVDCADGCNDSDGDLYGEPGGAASTCLGADCDETSATCNADCTTDADGDGTVDCNDACLDADGDGYGTAGGAGNACTGADCDDAIDTCNVDCTADLDIDGVIDCNDGCLDDDRDNYGVGPACTAADCDDALTSCTNDCSTNVDADAMVDCADTCIDRDGDTYGAGGGAGNTCAAADCNDNAGTCRTDCVTNVDLDGTPDCADTCLDRDGDGYGNAGGAGNTCTGTDCDDVVASCNTNCTTNVDNDAIPDCRDNCLDSDGDNYGIGPGCTGADCNDAIPTCAVNCVANADGDALIDCNDPCIDSDGDGYGTNGGAGTCIGSDCDETHIACNSNCIACLPNALVLTSNSPVARCTDATLSIDLDNYDNAESDLTCDSPQISVVPLETFASGAFGRWSSRSSIVDVTIRTFPDGFPATCNTVNYVRFNQNGPDWFQLATPINATNLESISVSAQIGYDTGTDNGDNISLQACCGAGCTPANIMTFLNGSSGGTDNCTVYNVTLPAALDNCASLQIRFSYPNAGDNAAVDSIEVFGFVTSHGVPVEGAQGVYSAQFRVCEAATVPVTCTWNNGVNTPRADTDNVVFQ